MSRWDARRAKTKGMAPARPTTCVHCQRRLPADRYLYCSDECAELSRAKAKR